MATKRSLEGEEVPTQEGTGKKTKIEGETSNIPLVETRLLIENHEAGTIIGKGGANVVQIRQDSQAFVSILKNDNTVSKERVLVLKGTIEYNTEAIKLISNLLVASQVARKQKLADEQGVENTAPTPNSQIKLLIHKLYAGCIIGKGGEVIKKIKADTGANVSLSTEPLAGSTEKTATLTGTSDQVYAAAQQVLQQVHQNPLRGSSANIPYTPGAAVLQAQQQAYNPYGNVFGAPQAPTNNIYGQQQGHPGLPSPFGAPQGFGAPQAPTNNIYGQQQQQGHPGLPSPFGAPQGFGAPPQQPGATKTEKIVIPTVCAGSVIGKGGSIIKEIKSQSGANITIADPAPTAPGDRVVSVIGSAQSIQTAIFLIRQRVEAYTPPGGATGQQAYGGY